MKSRLFFAQPVLAQPADQRCRPAHRQPHQVALVLPADAPPSPPRWPPAPRPPAAERAAPPRSPDRSAARGRWPRAAPPSPRRCAPRRPLRRQPRVRSSSPSRSCSPSRSILFSTSMRGLPRRFQLAQNLLHLRLLLLAVGRGRVAHVQQHLGLRHLFQRGAEAGDQRVRQVADEAHRVRQQNLAAAGQLDGAQLGVERGEHPRRLQDLRAGQPVEERALAGVGVAHQRHRGHRHRLAPLALLLAHAAHRVQFELSWSMRR